jgi:hypothetical protein
MTLDDKTNNHMYKVSEKKIMFVDFCCFLECLFDICNVFFVLYNW